MRGRNIFEVVNVLDISIEYEILRIYQVDSANAVPHYTVRNYAFKLPTFGDIEGVNPAGVQWSGISITLEEPPSWHSWAQRKLSLLNILLTINGPLLS